MPCTTSIEIINKIKRKDGNVIEFRCDYCNNIYYKNKIYWYQSYIRKGITYCSSKCNTNHRPIKTGSTIVECKHCSKSISVVRGRQQRRENHFCSQSCAAIYNNTHKKYGTRRSKLERWVEERLKEIYPLIVFEFNMKTAINSELDIYIPSLQLAFELNGIFHYEIIFNETLLDKIKNNDSRKMQACIEKGIELCIIDTSGQTYFKKENSQKYLDIIISIINAKENRLRGI